MEQMDSADPPLAVHGFYGGRHRQHRRNSTEEVHELGGPVGSHPARLAVFHRSVPVRAAVRREVGQRATHRLNGWQASVLWALVLSSGGCLQATSASAWAPRSGL